MSDDNEPDEIEIDEIENLETLMADFGLTRESTIGELLEALENENDSEA
jgi:hypothetical protein